VIVMDAQEQRARGTLVEALSSALERGGSGLANAPELLRRLLADESWRSFVTQRGELVEHERFVDFVTIPPLKGLGASLVLVRRIIEAESDKAKRAKTLDLLDRATQVDHGGDRHSEAFKLHNIHLEGDSSNGAKNKAPTGTSRAAGLRRLRKDRPDLHAEVLAGRLSAHGAMVKAGFRRKSVTVPVDSPENTARALRRSLDPDTLAEVARLIVARDDG
jgi:hypothetical protein